MKYNKRYFTILLSLFLLSLGYPSHSSGKEIHAKSSEVIKLRLLETTDLHASLVNYNYYHRKEDNRIGFVKTASLIKQAREEVNNSMLFDVGDHLQGSPLGGYMAWVSGVPFGEIHPVYRAFNFLNYDAITIGNHEFNFGTAFLNKSLRGAKMPVVNANMVYAANHKPFLPPYVILNRTFLDQNGKKHKLRIGVIGVLPPQTMYWDKDKLQGKVMVLPIVSAIQKYIPVIKKKRTDLIIVLAHTGISSDPYDPGTENAAYYLTEFPDIDAVLTGHSHCVFPGPAYKALPHTNLQTGTIHGKPVVMAGSHGSRLGVIDLKLRKIQGKWTVTNSASSTRMIADENGNPLVQTDQRLYNLIKMEHEKTIDYLKKLGH